MPAFFITAVSGFIIPHKRRQATLKLLTNSLFCNLLSAAIEPIYQSHLNALQRIFRRPPEDLVHRNTRSVHQIFEKARVSRIIDKLSKK